MNDVREFKSNSQANSYLKQDAIAKQTHELLMGKSFELKKNLNKQDLQVKSIPHSYINQNDEIGEMVIQGQESPLISKDHRKMINQDETFSIKLGKIGGKVVNIDP